MERAARLIAKSKNSKRILTEDEIARAVWPVAVGKAVAAHTSRIRLVRSTLVIDVEDAIWQRQLHSLTAQIVERLRKITGSDTVRDLEFRIAIPRRQPQRAESRSDGDEADAISDPVLQKLYRLSRKRALG
jgi:Dna[CI] antecedent, DciA